MMTNGIYHEQTGRNDLARIHIADLEKDIKILQVTDSHITEADERDPEAQAHVENRGQGLFYKNTPNGESCLNVFEKTMTMGRDSGVNGCVLTGDIIDFPTWKNIDELSNIIKDFEAPILFTPGNHDWSFPNLVGTHAQQKYYPRLHGLTNNNPSYQSTELCGVRLISLDNSTYQVSHEQVEFLKQELAKGQPSLLFIHIPLWIESLAPDVIKQWGAPIMMATQQGWTKEKRERWKVEGNDPSTLECYELLTQGKNDNLAGIFCGHVHLSHTDSYREGRYQYVTQQGYTGGYRIIELLKA
jgi:hypothetical protein